MRVKSRRGSVILRAHATEEVRPGHAFIAMHWGRNVLSSSGVNELTLNHVDPHSSSPNSSTPLCRSRRSSCRIRPC